MAMDPILKPSIRPDGRGTIQVVLNDGATSVSAICTSNMINKWAKCKPFRYDVPFFIGTDMVDANTNRKNACRSINYGLVAPSASADPDVAAQGEWTYNKPEGAGSGSPFRIADFYGYVHDTGAPIKKNENRYTKILINKFWDISKTLFFILSADNQNVGVTLNELFERGMLDSNTDYYISVVWNDNGVRKVVTAQDPFSSTQITGNRDVVIPANDSQHPLSVVNTTCSILACNAQHTNPSTVADSDRFIALPVDDVDEWQNIPFIVEDNSHLVFDWLGIGLEGTGTARNFFDIKDYMPSRVPSGQTLSHWSGYLSNVQRGLLFVRFSVTNTDEIERTLLTSAFRMRMTRSLHTNDSSDGTNWVGGSDVSPILLYDDEGSLITASSVTIPAGGTMTFRIGYIHEMNGLLVQSRYSDPAGESNDPITWNDSELIIKYYISGTIDKTLATVGIAIHTHNLD